MAINIFKNKKPASAKTGKEEPAKKETTAANHAVRRTIIQGLLKQPHATEKALGMSAQRKYVFVVSNKATKPLVKREIARRYGVEVANVNMLRKMIRPRRWGYKMGKSSLFKKAVVTLKENQKLEIT